MTRCPPTALACDRVSKVTCASRWDMMTQPVNRSAGALDGIEPENSDALVEHPVSARSRDERKTADARTERTAPDEDDVEKQSPNTDTARALGKGLVALAALAIGGVVVARSRHRQESPSPIRDAGVPGRSPSAPVGAGSAVSTGDLLRGSAPTPLSHPQQASSAPQSPFQPLNGSQPTTPAPRPQPRRDPVRDWACEQASNQLRINPVRPWT